MASKQVSFCWGNFQKNISSGMNSLLQNEDFVDVTLAVEGKYLKAHKMVLSLCSPYFRELFKTSPCQHPIVFLQDVPYTIMSDLLQFMYKGEVKISQDDLPVFIKTGKALQIIGIGDDYHNRFHSDQESTTEVPQNDHLKSKKTPLLESSIQPPLKRQRNRSSEQQQQKEESILQSLLKTGRISNNNNNNNNNDNNCSKKSKTQNTEEIVHLKLEACDQIQSLTDRSITIKNEFNDDHSDDTNIDDLSKENGYNEPTTDELKSTDAGPCTEQFERASRCIFCGERETTTYPLHCFPKNHTKLQKWIEALQVRNKAADFYRAKRICGRHFNRESYAHPFSRRLNQNAIPIPLSTR